MCTAAILRLYDFSLKSISAAASGVSTIARSIGRKRTCANWKAMAPGPYAEFAHRLLALLMTFWMVL